MPLTKKSDPPPRPDYTAFARWIAGLVVGEISIRTEKGLDVDDKPFLPYSEGYKKLLQRMGEGTNVDLTVSGGMLASLAVQAVQTTGTSTTMTLAPGTGTSPVVRPPKTGRKTASRTAGRRSPPHVVLGGYHHNGEGHNKVRRWLGLSPAGRRRILDAIAKNKRAEAIRALGIIVS